MSELERQAVVVARSEEEVRAIQACIDLECALCPPNQEHWDLQQAAVILVVGWEVDGYAVCAALRTLSAAPIILLLAEAPPLSRVRGLEAGADLVLPRDAIGDELSAHARALIRRHKMPPADEAYKLLRRNFI